MYGRQVEKECRRISASGWLWRYSPAEWKSLLQNGSIYLTGGARLECRATAHLPTSQQIHEYFVPIFVIWVKVACRRDNGRCRPPPPVRMPFGLKNIIHFETSVLSCMSAVFALFFACLHLICWLCFCCCFCFTLFVRSLEPWRRFYACYTYFFLHIVRLYECLCMQTIWCC